MNGRIPKILIGQRDSAILPSMGTLFPSPRFEIRSARRGDEILSAMGNDFRPDLLLLDAGMQEPDAAQICRTLKASPDTSTIPILMLTQESEPDSQQEAIEAGCDDLLMEPVLPNVLVA